ncbi:MAG: GNAT family N-acetyltransferase [Rhizobiaceae bacterium]
MDILVTKRLTLRPPLDVDAEAITAALQNTNVTRMLSAAPQPYGISDAQSWINRWQDKQDKTCFVIYSQKLMGVVSVEADNNTANLGYWLDEPHWSQGYMSEATRAVVSHVFRKHGYDEITSGAYEDNPGSQRVLEKLGFEQTEISPHFNKTRNCEVSCKQAKLTRSTFENLFGSLDETKAA